MSAITLSGLHTYPVKSTSGITLSRANVDELGLAFDRRFVLSDPAGHFITARTEPTLCLVQPTLTESGIVLSAPNMSNLTLNYTSFSKKYQSVDVWGDDVPGQVCSQLASKWFSYYLQRPCQLLFFGPDSYRERKPNTDKARKLAFADGYPLLLISQASLDDLNQRLIGNQESPVLMAQFRPNIVVEDCLAFEEDTWHHIRIGEVEFIVSKPCERCILTTVDIETGKKHLNQQPLRMLRAFRQAVNGEVLFGQNLIALNQGVLKIGDKLEIITKQSPPIVKAIKETALVTQTTGYNNEGHIQLTCQKILTETHDVKTFVFSWPASVKLKQQAGQHITFSINVFGTEYPCCYTISSNPSEKQQLKLTIKRVPEGKVSNYFHDYFGVGNIVKAHMPSGQFYLPIDTPEKVLLLSAGSGITPMLSMLRDMVENQAKNHVVFLHSARSEDDLIARDEIDKLSKQHGNCQIIYTLTQKVSPQWRGYQGHLSGDMLANIPQLAEYEVFICGPDGFRQSAQQYLVKQGVNKGQIHWESFGKKARRAAPVSTKQQLIINFDTWQKEYQGDNQKTILEHAEDSGINLPYSCRAGLCGACKAKLISGSVEQENSDCLTIQEKQAGYILCCTAVATSDVRVRHE